MLSPTGLLSNPSLNKLPFHLGPHTGAAHRAGDRLFLEAMILPIFPFCEAGIGFPFNPDDLDDNYTIIFGVKHIGNVVRVTVKFSGEFSLASR